MWNLILIRILFVYKKKVASINFIFTSIGKLGAINKLYDDNIMVYSQYEMKMTTQNRNDND